MVLQRAAKFVIEYPRLTLALILFILSLAVLAVNGIKEGPELKGGVILELYAPGYTVTLKAPNYSQLLHLSGIEIISYDNNTHVATLVVFDNATLEYIKTHFNVISISDSLPPSYIYYRIVSIIRERINALGVSGITVGTWANKYIIIEAPISVKDQINKILELGNFEIKVGNQTVATGSDVIPSSVRVTEDAEGQWGVDFILNQQAAKRLMEAVKAHDYKVNITMVFDGKVIFSAPPAPGLIAEWQAGKLVTGFRAITGAAGYYELVALNCSPGILYNLGADRVYQVANNTYMVHFPREISKEKVISELNKSGCVVLSFASSKDRAEMLALALRSGSLPVKLHVISSYYIEPVLAQEIRTMAIVLFLAAFLGVFVVIYLRYRKFVYVLPIYLTLIMEITLILGAASLIEWVIDLPAIIGLLLVVATGVDDQIVILDEVLFGKKLKHAIKGAFFIIYASALTTIATISPLFWVYQFRGFALTTVLGILIGVFITRPAYAEIVEKLFKKV